MDEDFTPVLVPTPAPQLRHILCNAFAFGGNDTALVFSQYDTAQLGEQPSAIPAPRAVYLHQLLRYEDLAPEDLPKITSHGGTASHAFIEARIASVARSLGKGGTK